MVSPPLDAADASGSPSVPAAETRLLAADVGSVYTRVYLIEDVEGERRLVAAGQAPTVADTGQPAVAAALAQALSRALDHTGRSPERGAAETSPRILMTSLAAVPRIAVVAPREDDAREIAAAFEALPVRVLDPILREGAAGDPEVLLGQLEAQAPDAIVIAGGARAADQPLAEGAVEAVARGFGARAPLVMLAGGRPFVNAAGPLLGALRSVDAAGDAARVGVALRDAARGLAGERLGEPDLRSRPLAGWDAPLSSSLDGVCAATELIAERYDVDALTLDLGAGHAMAVAAIGSAGRRRLAVAARDDLGLRLGRLRLLREAGAAQINRWLPADLDDSALLAEVRRGSLVPAGLPETVDDLLIEHAFAREALRLAVQDLSRALGSGASPNPPLPPIDLLVGSGGVLAAVPRLMQAALILLDAAQPEALTQLALDRAAALPLLGQIARREGAAGLGAALERDGLLNLGLCIAPVGAGQEGETAIKVEVAYTNRPPVTVEVPFGAVETVPLPIGERAALKLWPAKDFDVGLGRGNAATPRSEVEGGAVGIIVDARGRPLALPDTAEKRQAKLLQWLQGTRAYPHLSFVAPAVAATAEGAV